MYRYDNACTNSDVWKEISYEEALEIIEANKPVDLEVKLK